MKSRLAVLTVALALVGVSNAQAANITVNSLAGVTYSTTGINDFSATSSQMNGMEITANWTDGTGAHSQTLAWNSGVTFTGTNFDLAVTGDTFDNNAWQLDFSVTGTGLLQSLVFNGVPGNTIFDRTNPNTGTAGSDQGKDLAGFGPYEICTATLFGFCIQTQEGNITATYFNQVILNANAHVGDTYAGLRIDFLSFGGLGESTDWQFSLDTDIATTALLVPGTQSTVPEPGSMLLLGTGLLGLAAAARRRARKA